MGLGGDVVRERVFLGDGKRLAACKGRAVAVFDVSGVLFAGTCGVVIDDHGATV